MPRLHLAWLCCSTGAPVGSLYGVCLVCQTLYGCQRCVLCQRRWHDPQPGDVRWLEEAGGYMCAGDCFPDHGPAMRAWERELPPDR